MYILQGDLTQDKLLEILQQWFVNDNPKLEKYYNYYMGNQAIMHKVYADTTKPCNRIVTNYCHQIVQQYLGYNIGIPVTYEVDDEVRDILDYNDVIEKDNLFLRNALIYGKAFELQYLDVDKKDRFDVIDTRYGIDVYGDELSADELKYFIRLTCVDTIGQDKWRAEVYDKDNIYIYKATGKLTNLTLENTLRHNYGQVPVTVLSLNPEQESIFAQVMSLQDAYNTLVSSETDDWEAFVDAYLVLKGVTADDDDIADMRTNRVLILDPDSSADYLTKQINDSQIENMLDNIKQNIYKMSNCPDFSDREFMAQSGIALQYKLVGFSNVSRAIMNRMEKALRKRLELITGIEALKGTEFTDATISFSENIPANTLDTANVINQLRGIVSNRTLLSLLPFIEDPDLELENLKTEQQANMELYDFGISKDGEDDEA